MPSVEGVDDNVPPAGYGVHGRSNRGGSGVYGRSDGNPSGPGVYGFSSSGIGMAGSSMRNIGVLGSSPLYEGVYGQSDSGRGVSGLSKLNYGVLGQGPIGVGGFGYGRGSYGVLGVSTSDGYGVIGGSYNGTGVYGQSDSSYGVQGLSKKEGGSGVYGDCSGEAGSGVRGTGDDGVLGEGSTGVRGVGGYAGVWGISDKGYGLFGRSTRNHGLLAVSEKGYAAYLQGDVYIKGNLQKSGGRFKIDHPLDPANKYLSHSFVESPDMKNVYDGVVALDDKGEAVIELPDWFGALNKDFRYQLTAIGAPGPNLYIAEEICDAVANYSNSNSSSSNQNNDSSHFKIAGGTSSMKVSWQVTGIRQDPWANVNRIQVEEDKPDKEKGYYTYPDLYEQPPEKGISQLLFPKEEKWRQQPIK